MQSDAMIQKMAMIDDVAKNGDDRWCGATIQKMITQHHLREQRLE